MIDYNMSNLNMHMKRIEFKTVTFGRNITKKKHSLACTNKNKHIFIQTSLMNHFVNWFGQLIENKLTYTMACIYISVFIFVSGSFLLIILICFNE